MCQGLDKEGKGDAEGRRRKATQGYINLRSGRKRRKAVAIARGKANTVPY